MTERRSSSKYSIGAICTLAFILVALLGSPHLLAQTLDPPTTVCLNEEFDVQWTGPNGAGDRITVAQSFHAANQSSSFRETMDGSPAKLQAPGQEGAFEVRYVQAEPESILVRRGINVINCLSSTPSTGEPGTPSDPAGTSSDPAGDTPAAQHPAGVNQAVLVSGVQTNYGDVVHQTSPYGDFDGRIEALCGASDTIGWAMNSIIDQIEQSMAEAGSPITFGMIEALPGAPSRAAIAAGMRTARDEFCNQEEEPPQVQPFTITYAYCRMAMVTPYQVMDIHLPPQIGTGMMSVADYVEGEAIQVTLSRSFDAAATVTGAGWSSQVSMTSPTHGGTRIGYPTTQYQFGYEGGLGGGGMVPFANLVTTENRGTVWVSDAVPGLDIIRSFYENLTSEVSPELASNSFFGGLISNLVGMLRNGLPLEIEQTIESKVLGRTSVSGRSHSIVTDIRLVDFRPAWCSESLLPPGMPVRDIDQEIANAMGQSGAQSGEIAEAMQQYEQAMQQMTPEERQMMEQFGLGSMMEQMTGGGNPAGRQPGGAAVAGAQTGSAASRASGSNMPPAEELNSGNVTESVQRHLQALGYDVGDTNGEMSMETTIAISTFQAEKGMQVTGEVTPQLLGILSAEVDSRR